MRKVAVIIPTFNCESHLGEALESVFSQTYSNFDIWVVNDGSTDGTATLLRKFAHRVTVLSHQPARGPAAARNLAIRALPPDCEYIAFLDADDIWSPPKLAMQVDFLEGHSAIGLVNTDFSCFSSDRPPEKSSIRSYCAMYRCTGWDFSDVYPEKVEFNFGDVTIAAHCGWIFDKMLYGYGTLTSTIMIRKTCLETVGLFDERFWIAEDYDLYCRIAKTYPISYLDIVTTRKRRHANQLCAQPGTGLALAESWRRIVVRHWQQDTETYRQWKPTVDKRLAELDYSMGLQHREGGDVLRARRCFLQSIHEDWSRPTVMLYYLETCLPSAGAGMAKILFKALRHICRYWKYHFRALTQSFRS